MRFVIITGLSGAGKTSCLHCFEDMGYFCVDNLLPTLIPKFGELIQQTGGKISKVAVVADIRGGDFFEGIYEALVGLKNYGLSYEILFLDASDDELIKRYKATRRRHPLQAPGERMEDGIQAERQMLQRLKESANRIIDTGKLQIAQLRELLAQIYSENSMANAMMTSVVSFGFKYGIPLDADLVFDVRFLSNPFYIDVLRPHNGLDDDVKEYLESLVETKEFLEKLQDMLLYLLPLYYKEGKNQIVIAIGCTGGKHRSVMIADAIYQRLKRAGHHTVVTHRDIEIEPIKL